MKEKIVRYIMNKYGMGYIEAVQYCEKNGLF